MYIPGINRIGTKHIWHVGLGQFCLTASAYVILLMTASQSIMDLLSDV